MSRSEDTTTHEAWTARWAGGLAADISTPRGHRLRADEPVSIGGADSGPMPTELMAAGLASCFCLAVVWAAGKLRIEIDDIEVRVEARRAPGEPRYEGYDVEVVATPAPDDIDRAVELASRYCWVSNTLRQPPEITYRVKRP